MDDVVAASGLGKGTVYWHYKSKDGLLAAVMHRFLAIELHKLEGITSADTSIADTLIAFAGQIAADLHQLGPLMQLTLEFYSIALRKDWARRLLRGYYAEFEAVLRSIVEAGIERGEFRRVGAAEVAVALTALLEGTILLWVVDSQTVQLEHHVDAALRLMLDGLRAYPESGQPRQRQ